VLRIFIIDEMPLVSKEGSLIPNCSLTASIVVFVGGLEVVASDSGPLPDAAEEMKSVDRWDYKCGEMHTALLLMLFLEATICSLRTVKRLLDLCHLCLKGGYPGHVP